MRIKHIRFDGIDPFAVPGSGYTECDAYFDYAEGEGCYLPATREMITRVVRNGVEFDICTAICPEHYDGQAEVLEQNRADTRQAIEEMNR